LKWLIHLQILFPAQAANAENIPKWLIEAIIGFGRNSVNEGALHVSRFSFHVPR
jgi:hypothetical protein